MGSKKNIIFIAISLGVLYYFFSSSIQSHIRPLTSAVRNIFINSYTITKSSFEKYLNQTETIDRLEKENKELAKNSLIFKNYIKEVKELSVMQSATIPNAADKLLRVRVHSYSNLPNLYRVHLGSVPENELAADKTVFGLVYPTANKVDSVTVGIAVKNQNGKLEAYLNGDGKCSYAVYIGAAKAPGVLLGRDDDKLTIKYIPSWIDVKEGDEVETSGLDNIFFEGIKVGIVKQVSSGNAYKEASVQPYFNVLNPSYFYLIKRAK